MKVTIHCDDEFEARCCLRSRDMLAVLRDLAKEMHCVHRNKLPLSAWLRCWEATDMMRVEIEGRDDDLVREVSLAWMRRLYDHCRGCGVDLDDDVEVGS